MIRTIARLRHAVGVMVWVAVWTVGVPAGLITVAGPPVPSHRPSIIELTGWLQDPLQPALVAAAAVYTGWLLWAIISVAVLARSMRQLPLIVRRRLPRWLPPSPLQGLSATVLGAAAVASPVTAAATSP